MAKLYVYIHIDILMQIIEFTIEYIICDSFTEKYCYTVNCKDLFSQPGWHISHVLLEYNGLHN